MNYSSENYGMQARVCKKRPSNHGLLYMGILWSRSKSFKTRLLPIEKTLKKEIELAHDTGCAVNTNKDTLPLCSLWEKTGKTIDSDLQLLQ